MKSTEIRAIRKKFREDKEQGHKRVAPASLIVNAADDPTTMFNTAGMQQFVPYLMGKPHPQGRRIYNIQGCVRTTDIEEVGDVSHLTMFEMMGNRSLGDYFKTESITWSWKFLTSKEWLGLDPTKLAVSVFEGDADGPRDEESAYLREQIGVSKERIAYLGKKNNRRGPAGATGPCGPDTEIFYRIGEGDAPAKFDPDKDDALWLEIRNNVFMAYYKNDQGTFEELKDKNVDTGMGFERLCMVVQGQKMKQEGKITALNQLSVYDVDVFSLLLKKIDEFVGNEKAKRIIADHMRTSLFLIEEGLIPSNEGKGYVLRRLIRRAYFQYMSNRKEEYMQTGQFTDIAFAAVEIMNDIYEKKLSKTTVGVIVGETTKFADTITAGKRIMDIYLGDSQGTKIFPGDKAFKLYDTYGFPIELTQELAQEKGMKVDMDGFSKAMQKAQETSRAGGKKMFTKEINRADHIEGLPQTKFVGYAELEKDGAKILKDFEIDGQRILVFDSTPFYAEGGGQTGDQGELVMDNGEKLLVKDVQKYGGVWLHFVE